MYKKYYHLTEKPFSLIPNPDFLYKSRQHENALTYLEYGLMENLGFILLTGEIGSGKTTLVRYLLNQVESQMDVAVIFNTNITSGQMIGMILSEFDLTPSGENKTANLDVLYTYLIDQFKKSKKTLLIIDEAQNLSPEVLEEVRMLSNLQTDNRMLLQIMLVGQPELRARLKTPQLIQLNQRIVAGYHLSALTRKETGAYIVSRLQKAGGLADIFTTDAIDRIHQASRGIPRTINLLCDSAMVYGFADELTHLDAAVIEEVIQDKNGIGIDTLDDNPPSVFSTDCDSFPGAGDRDTQNLMERIAVLEQNVRQMQLQLNRQMEQLEQVSESSQKEEILRLYKMVQDERKKNEGLVAANAQLHMKLNVFRNRRIKKKQF